MVGDNGSMDATSELVLRDPALTLRLESVRPVPVTWLVSATLFDALAATSVQNGPERMG